MEQQYIQLSFWKVKPSRMAGDWEENGSREPIPMSMTKFSCSICIAKELKILFSPPVLCLNVCEHRIDSSPNSINVPWLFINREEVFFSTCILTWLFRSYMHKFCRAFFIIMKCTLVHNNLYYCNKAFYLFIFNFQVPTITIKLSNTTVNAIQIHVIIRNSNNCFNRLLSTKPICCKP